MSDQPGTRLLPAAACLSIMLLLLIPALAPASAAQAPGGEWTSYTDGFSNSRYQAASTVTSSNAAGLHLAWTLTTPAAVSSTPAVSAGVAYFSDYAGNVYAVYMSNGSTKWVNHTNLPITSSPLVANGFVYVTAGVTSMQVMALSQSTGSIVWKTHPLGSENAIFSSPQLYQGRLIFGLAENGPETNANHKGSVVALNATTGTLIWTFKTMIGDAGGAGVWGTVVIDPTLNEAIFGTGNSYTASSNSLYAYSVVAVSATTGALKWYNQLYPNSFAGGDQDFGSTANLFSYNTCSGTSCTTHKAVGIANKNGIYYVYDRTTGSLLTSVTVGAFNIGSGGFVYGSPNVPTVFVPSDYVCNCGTKGALTAINPATATVVWRFLLPGHALYGSIALAPGLAMVADTLGNLYGVSTSTGTALFQTTLPLGSFAGVSIAEGYVLAPFGVPGITSGGLSAYSA